MQNIEVQTIVARQESGSHVFQSFCGKADDIARRAFELFEERGGTDGHAVEDWLRAEQEIFGGATAELSEDETRYQIRLALPEFEAGQVEGAASEREVVVRALMSESTSQGTDVMSVEIEIGRVFKRFQLPTPLEAGKVSASLTDGILRIVALKAGATGLPVAKGDGPRASGACDSKCKNGCASASASRTLYRPLVS
jgi:HSP20 family molecular chaperone IbpA